MTLHLPGEHKPGEHKPDSQVIVVEHLKCRRPMMWKLTWAAIVTVSSVGIGWGTWMTVKAFSAESDIKVNASQHLQLDNTLQEMRNESKEMRGDIKELLRRTSGGKVSLTESLREVDNP